jgi:hypothetical protein
VTVARSRPDERAERAAADCEADVSALPILMAVRIKGRATQDAIATAAGMTAREAGAALTDACAAALVQAVQGGVPARGGSDPAAPETFALAAGGHVALGALLARERRDHAALARAYEAFMAVDTRVKAAITGWQLASTGAARLAHGAALRNVGAEAGAAVDRLTALVPRYAAYARRVGTAREALRAGDERYVASPRVDSLHQVWFELHQDLLLTLGRERGT